MDAQLNRQIMQLWLMALNKGIPQEDVAEGLYFALTDEVAPKEAAVIPNVVDFCGYMQQRKLGRALTIVEKRELIMEAMRFVKRGGSVPNLGFMRLFSVFPTISTIVGAIALWKDFSWILLVTLLGAVLLGFGRWLAAQAHPSAGTYILVGLVSALACLILSICQLTGLFHAP